jgi:2-succinyl-5-enolpyruvyl-6-hydroxy-3-cyclohexene-1-carboxylate synthase
VIESTTPPDLTVTDGAFGQYTASIHAAGLVDELIRSGVTNACVAPGSTSAPLSVALLRDQRVHVSVAIDERSAGFMALGLAKQSHRPAVVVSTSGTAAANFLPAVVEAFNSRTPLIVITADRPAELRDAGASSTIDQVKLFGHHVVFFVDLGPPRSASDSLAFWRSVACRAVAEATAAVPGPVHVNVAFRDPAIPPVGHPAARVDTGRPAGRPWTAVSSVRPRPTSDDVARLAAIVKANPRGLIVAGGEHEVDRDAVLALARAARWPVLAEPCSGLRSGRESVSAYEALLRSRFSESHAPSLVLRLCGTALSPTVLAHTACAQQIAVDPYARWPDPGRILSWVIRADPDAICEDVASEIGDRGSSAWVESWLAADAIASRAMDDVLDSDPTVSEPKLARDVAALVPPQTTIVVGPSMPLRDLEWFMRPRADVRVLANRGTNGIDGFVSTAVGVAVASRAPVCALVGDLTMLHDQNGLLLARREDIDLTYIIVNNNGGGVFSLTAPPECEDVFERVYGAGQDVDFEALAHLYRLPYTRVETAASLQGTLASMPDSGVRLIEVRSDRQAIVSLHHRLWAAAAAALEFRETSVEDADLTSGEPPWPAAAEADGDGSWRNGPTYTTAA